MESLDAQKLIGNMSKVKTKQECTKMLKCSYLREANGGFTTPSTDMNLGQVHCLASRTPTLDIEPEITKSWKFL